MALTKRERRKQKDRWMDACERWKKALWLGQVDVTYVFLMKAPDGAETTTPGWKSFADAVAKPEYMEAQITVYDVELISTLSDDELDEAARHEMIHVLLGWYDSLIRDLFEPMSEKVAAGWEKYRHNVIEYTTSRLEKALATLRLPREPKKKS
jgi:hypothetical protein